MDSLGSTNALSSYEETKRANGIRPPRCGRRLTTRGCSDSWTLAVATTFLASRSGAMRRLITHRTTLSIFLVCATGQQPRLSALLLSKRLKILDSPCLQRTRSERLLLGWRGRMESRRVRTYYRFFMTVD